MCLIAFALNTHPDWPLLIAANRDEFLDRPTAPLHRWLLDDGTEVVGGRDLRDGGTWLGLSPQGRVAISTESTSKSGSDSGAGGAVTVASNLPDGQGGTIAAEDVQRAHVATLAFEFARTLSTAEVTNLRAAA